MKNKLSPKWTGPLRIIEELGNDADLAGDSIVEGLAMSNYVFRKNVPSTSPKAPSELAKHNKRPF